MKPNLKLMLGVFVEVMTDRYISVSNETENGKFEKKKPFVIAGYLIDFDDEWVYIGSSEDQISDMIKVKRIITIGKSAPVDEYESMLDEVPTPENDDEFN
jgi:hypothetical protein